MKENDLLGKPLIKAVLAAIHRGSPNPPDWLIENVDTALLPENRKKTLAMANQAKKEGRLSKPFIEFGLWVAVGGIDQAYETFDAFRETAPQFLQLEFILADEGREFRQDPRFAKLAREIGWEEYWKTFGGPDID